MTWRPLHIVVGISTLTWWTLFVCSTRPDFATVGHSKSFQAAHRSTSSSYNCFRGSPLTCDPSDVHHAPRGSEVLHGELQWLGPLFRLPGAHPAKQVAQRSRLVESPTLYQLVGPKKIRLSGKARCDFHPRTCVSTYVSIYVYLFVGLKPLLLDLTSQ